MNAPEEASGEHFKPSQSDDKAGEKGISGNKTADTDTDKDANKDAVGNDGKTINPQKSVAADNAAEFVSLAIQKTPADQDTRFGVWFEPLLPRLCPQREF